MQYQNVCIEGMGYFIPDRVVTSDWIEEQLAPIYRALQIPIGRIEQLTRIKERRWFDEGVSFSDAATWAAEKALTDAGVDRSEIGFLINTSVCRDYIEPATAVIVHDNLQLPPTAMNFDLTNACMGFLNGMVVAANMIELGQIETALVVSAEGVREGQLATIERLLANPPDMASFRDNLATFTLGSGSVAMVLTHKSRSRTGKQLLGGFTYAQTQHHPLCVAQRDWMRTDSTALLQEGLKVIAAAWQGFQKEMGWTNDMVERIFTHQVSEKQRVLGLQMLGLPEGLDYPTLIHLGNIASVSCPISMALARDAGFLQDGQRAVMIGVGSGINSIILGVQW
ncbi:MAG: 3-oxoacyl-ACP synthase III [Anaerolineae bacterium]|nr:3-oxoacyl-ACP synthase III [Anaerolineae bacterium]